MTTMPARLAACAAFKIKQRLSPPQIGDAPWFTDPAAVGYFSEKLERADRYVEFGTGGSTVMAARLGKRFVSVETDAFYCECVKQKVGKTDGHILYADIGITEELGRPFIKRPTPERLAKWRRYSEAPWAYIDDPDLVLVDGRFRVLCALGALLKMRQDAILIFDNFDRPYYKAVLDFAEPLATMGDTAALRKKRGIEERAIEAAMTRFCAEYI